MKTIDRPYSVERAAKIKNVIAVSSGNFLEMYDFIGAGTFRSSLAA